MLNKITRKTEIGLPVKPKFSRAIESRVLLIKMILHNVLGQNCFGCHLCEDSVFIFIFERIHKSHFLERTQDCES